MDYTGRRSARGRLDRRHKRAHQNDLRLESFGVHAHREVGGQRLGRRRNRGGKQRFCLEAGETEFRRDRAGQWAQQRFQQCQVDRAERFGGAGAPGRAAGRLDQQLSQARREDQHRADIAGAGRKAGNRLAARVAALAHGGFKRGARNDGRHGGDRQAAAFAHRHGQAGGKPAGEVMIVRTGFGRRAEVFHRTGGGSDRRLGWQVRQVRTQQCLDLGRRKLAAGGQQHAVGFGPFERSRHLGHHLPFPARRHVPAVIGAVSQRRRRLSRGSNPGHPTFIAVSG